MKLGWCPVFHRRVMSTVSSKISESMDRICRKGIIAVCQMRASENKEENLQTCKELICSAKRFNAQMVFFPEACDYVAGSKVQTVKLAENMDGPTMQAYRNLAKLHDVWLSLGGIHVKVDENTVANTHVLIDACGNVASTYSKLHLFDVDYKEGNVNLKESSYCKRGLQLSPPVRTPVGNVGLSICYDLRFPEQSLTLRLQGADVLTYPSAFTFATGAAHWEPLLRARAIETQCYVVAAAQSGMHNDKRSSWGHAMVVDPWGTIIAQCSDGANIAIAEIDHDLLRRTRLSMPVLEHRRNDVYPAMNSLETEQDSAEELDSKSFKFGQVSVKGTGVFLKSNGTIAFTNKKCVVPGHVLVAPIRCVARLSHLSPEEVSDLFAIVHKVVPVVERVYGATSSTVVVQDGKDAGQTIEHVHVHILPRRPGDYLNNDDIYRDLAKHDKEECTTGKWRTEGEMAAESMTLRPHFT